MNNIHSRFSGASWYKYYEDTFSDNKMLVSGLGGTGSWIAFLLARAGHHVIANDYDKIEDHNLSGQFFNITQVGEYKTEAVKSNIYYFSNDYIEIINRKIEDLNINIILNTNIVFSCFDNMESRKHLFTIWKQNPNRLVFVDPRLSFNFFQLFFVTKENEEEYIKTLINDELIPNEVCTLKQTTSMATLIASTAVNYLNNFIINLKENNKIMDIPFYTEYDLNLNIWKNEYK